MNLYQEIVIARNSAQRHLVALLSLNHDVLQQIDTTWKYPVVVRNNPHLLKYTNVSLLATFTDALSSVGSFHQMVETYQIALPESDVFALAFSVVGEELRAIWPLFYATAVPLIPNEYVSDSVEQLLARGAPQPEQLKIVAETGACLQELGWDLGSYVGDFITEAQNILLENTFRRVAPRRQPNSAKHVVVTTDSSDRLRIEQHFTLRRRHIRESQQA